MSVFLSVSVFLSFKQSVKLMRPVPRSCLNITEWKYLVLTVVSSHIQQGEDRPRSKCSYSIQF